MKTDYRTKLEDHNFECECLNFEFVKKIEMVDIKIDELHALALSLLGKQDADLTAAKRKTASIIQDIGIVEGILDRLKQSADDLVNLLGEIEYEVGDCEQTEDVVELLAACKKDKRRAFTVKERIATHLRGLNASKNGLSELKWGDA